MKKLLTAILSLALVLALLPSAALADGSTSGTLQTEYLKAEYTLSDSVVTEYDLIECKLDFKISAVKPHNGPIYIIVFTLPTDLTSSHSGTGSLTTLQIVAQDGQLLVSHESSPAAPVADVENISVFLSAAGSAGFSVYLAEYTDKAEAEKANENLLSGTIPSGDNVASATLTAESYFVTLDYNDGDVTPDAKYASNGQSFTIPVTAPTRSGYVFRGWNDGTTTYQPGETVTRITDSTTLTAQWQNVDEVKIAWFPPALPPASPAPLGPLPNPAVTEKSRSICN